MTCPLCGDVCGCVPDDRHIALSGSPARSEDDWHIAMRAPGNGEMAQMNRPVAASLDCDAESPRPKFVVDPKDVGHPDSDRVAVSGSLDLSDSRPVTGPGAEEREAVPQPATALQPDLLDGPTDWREEVSARLHRYHARRRPRAPRYPSLRLKFEAPETTWAPSSRASEAPALAVHRAVVEEPAKPAPTPDPVPEPVIAPEPVRQQARHTQGSESTAKVIEFPRWSYSPAVRHSDLAEPVIDRPRILEAPEVVPPPPALGGITIEEEQKQEPERRPGIDMPLHSAPLQQRLFAVALDAVIVLLAGGAFGTIYYRIAGARPVASQIVGLAGGMLALLWLAYQYLLIVYSGTTPGLRAMKLQLQRFDGNPTNRRLRRWRVLGSVLSAISLGMGYAWQFLDEDALCWHERVTKTYLAPEKKSKS